jgi:hypothetical protein
VLARGEKIIVQADLRIKRHSRLAAFCREPWQQRLHLNINSDLQKGLKLLCLQRMMVLHELYGSRIARRSAVAVNTSNTKRERIGQLRETVGWMPCRKAT